MMGRVSDISPGTERAASSRAELFICLALAGVTLAVFGHACGNGFVNLDDETYVSRNPYLRQGLSLAGVRWAFTTFRAANWHPFTWLSLELDYTLYGLAPWGYHLTNLLLHAANAVLLFLALRRLTGALWASAAVAAFFALHPLRVESVAWIAERKDVLSLFFGLLALLAYAGYTRAPGWRSYLLVVLAFLL